MAKKIRKIIDGKIKWFGYRANDLGQTYQSPMLEVTDETTYVEAYKYRIYNLLSIIKKELPDKTYGIRGIFDKQSKEDIDIEIQEALRKKLNLTINKYTSYVKDREYHCSFTVTAPRGNLISLEMVL